MVFWRMARPLEASKYYSARNSSQYQQLSLSGPLCYVTSASCSTLTIYGPHIHVINNNTSKEPKIMVLVRKLVVSCMLNNIQFRATHVAGTNNSQADHLSRLQINTFRAAAPSAEPTPTQLPPSLLPANFSLT